MSEVAECYACFSDLKEGNYFKCSNERCENICVNCAIKYFKLCLTENQLPLCPHAGCQGYFSLKKISSYLPENQLLIYKNAIFSYYQRNKDTAVQSRINRVKLLEKLQKDRIDFIEKNFPLGIYRMAQIALPDEINNIKKLKEIIERRAKGGPLLPCRKTACQGFLDQKKQCNLCDTLFCVSCDRIKLDDHQCKAEDVETMKELQKIINCPECNVKVIKEEGCNFITCARCQTNFHYRDGNFTKEGSHGKNKKLEEKTATFFDSVSDMIAKTKHSIKFADMIKEIEGRAPKTPSEDQIEQAIVNWKQEESKISENETRELVLKYFQSYQSKLTKYRQYLHHLDEIESALRKGTLDREELENIWAIYCKD